MFGQQPGDHYWQSQSTEPEIDLHNTDNEGSLSPQQANDHGEEQASTQSTTTVVPSTETSSNENVDGTWGERDVGGPVSHRMAMEDFENMRRELSHISRSRSKSLTKSDHGGIFRTMTNKSRKSENPRLSRARDSDGFHIDAQAEKDIEAGDGASIAKHEEEFDLGPFIKDGHFEKRTENGDSAKKVGVVFKNLTVKGVGSKSVYGRTLPDAILGTFGPDLYRLTTQFVPILKFGRQQPTRILCDDFTGVVRNGEMMLVLGRPGSGCTTFLKAIANQRGDFAEVKGDVTYGGITAKRQHARYRGEVNYNPEDDQHFPSLNVWQTLRFSLMNKTRKRAKGEIEIVIRALMKMFGISHTRYTLVGNEYVRGISGGERKRVSIAETLATKSSVVCWDNSTRGLDASTALDYAKSLRVMTDVSNRTTLVTLYQAGEEIYKLMDKVLVIDEGRMMFQGPASDAKQYFIDLGFECPERETTADFLTSVTDPTQRVFRKGFEAQAPKTAEEFERAFKNSSNYQKVLQDVQDYERHLESTDFVDAREFEQSVKEQKSRHVSEKSNFTVSFWSQVMACTQREIWLVWGDKASIYTKLFIILANGFTVGSLFYNQPNDTDSAFTRGGATFFSILFLGWLQLSELMKAVSGRVVTARHKEYAFYRPSAVSLARVITDFLLILVQVVIFGTLMYFMTNLNRDASKFFIFALFVYTTTICITALYRMFASLSPQIDDAIRFSGITLNLLVIYAGYVIPKPTLLDQKIWFGWIYYINPISYAFEGVMTNEFSGRVMTCSADQLIPQGPGISADYQGCAIRGGRVGSNTVTGESYLALTYKYTRSHLWRNFGVIIAFTILYVLVTVVASEHFSFVGGGGGALVFKKSSKKKVIPKPGVADAEKAGNSGDKSASSSSSRDSNNGEPVHQMTTRDSVFAWTNVNYSVPYQGSHRQLLTNVNGYVKSGVMVALMGASGAGKTTLLNTLSQRQRVGVVSGDLFVDGRPPGPEFSRVTGYVEQSDLHDMTATIREAIEFSAILRQERYIPREEKLRYVDEIIELLELQEIEDVLISSLSLEQRKRVTIGVELAAKPSLLFLDEPTSGLDSGGATSIVRFLKKLSRAGHGLICTIHQPSSLLIQQFDMILALNPGGNTFYFGPVGENGSAVIKYFADRQVHCPPSKNIAEFILETAAKGGKRADGKRLDWNQEWRNSQENKDLTAEISYINAERSKLPVPSANTQYEFASPQWLQITTLTKRMFTQHWRDPSYLYGKLFVAVLIGIFNGFTFFKLGNTVQDMQNRAFTSFIIILIPPTVVNTVVPKFFKNLALWGARENPSKTYNWIAFSTASAVTEIPISIITGILYFLLWYFATGMPTDSSTAGYVFLMTILFFLFQASWGQWICAFAPSFTVISNLLPLFFVTFSTFNGVVRPYSQLPVIWKYSIYYMNPSTYWIGGVVAATFKDISVKCGPNEAALFNPPPGQTCLQYAGDFVQRAGQGYLTNPNATSECGYCAFSTGTDFMNALNITADDKWKYMGVFAGFCISNYALIYFFIYTVRIRGWSFGLGTVFGGLGKGVDLLKSLLMRIFTKVRGEKKA